MLLRRSHFSLAATLLGGRPLAQLPFAPAETLSTPIDSRLLCVDVEPDGDLDFIAGGISFTTLLLNDGHGNFSQSIIIPAGGTPFAFQGDGDTDLDVLLAAPQFGSHQYLENVGAQNFWPHTDTTVSLSLDTFIRQTFCMGFVDLDDKADLIVADESGGNTVITVWTGTGGAGFVMGPTINVPGEPLELLCANFDALPGDEVMIRTSDHYYLENVAGVLQGPVLQAPFLRPEDRVAACDVTGDDYLDLIVFRGLLGPNTVGTIDYWPYNPVSGGFPSALPTPFGAGAFSAVGCGDLDCDGDIDIVGGLHLDRELVWFENDNNQGFSDRQPLAKLPEFNDPLFAFREICVADVDGDKYPEVISSDNNDVLLFRNLTPTKRNRRRPGSLLTYPIHRSDAGMFTVLSVTNTHVGPVEPESLGGTTNVQFEYVNMLPNASNPMLPLDCYITDRVETLTPADTLSVLTACHNAANAVGYTVVTAQDPAQFKTAWSHDYLVGSELVLNASAGAFALNAIAFGTELADGQPTDIAPADGRADLNDIEYHAPSERVILDSFLALTNSHLSLIDLSGVPGGVNTIRADVWNDDELPFSTTFQFRCWFDLPLPMVSPVFTPQFLASLPNDPEELDTNCDGVGDLESGWALLRSVDLSTSNLSLPGAPFLGAISGGPGSFYGGRLLWESSSVQATGVATIY